MFLGDLPLETQYRILEHCYPSDLDVLSRVYSSVRDVVEYGLYSHIRYRARALNMIVMMGSSWDPQLVPKRLKKTKSLLHPGTILICCKQHHQTLCVERAVGPFCLVSALTKSQVRAKIRHPNASH